MMGLFGKRKKEEKTAEVWFDLGYKEKEPEKKIEYYSKCLELDPKNAYAWHNKGITLANLGRYEEAIGCYDRALEIDPKNAYAWYNKGNALADLGKYEEAIGCYDKVLEIDPEDAIAWNNKGNALNNLGRYEEAIGCYDKVLEIDPEDAIAWNNKGTALAHLGRYKEAIRFFDRALEIDPGYEEAKNNKKLAEEKLRAQKVRSITPEPSSTSLPALHLSVERTIYDPVTRDFIISKSRALPNVKNWVDRNDPSMYWLVMCVNNSSERAIDEWGIELEMPSTLRVLEAVVEGFEQRFSLRDSSSNPWSTSWTLGIPHHLGIVIPRNGSRRIYFKLASDVCGISYSIKGRIITPDMEIAIKEKQFRYSCDAATLKNAIVSDPEGAEEYTRRILLSTYSRDTAIKLLHSFKLVQEMERCCTIGDYEKIRDKMEILLDVLEGTGAGENLTRLVRKNLEAVRIMGDVESSAERVRRLCGNILDVWINEILKG